MARVKFSPADYLEAYKIFGSADEVARQVGVSARTVRRHLKKLGVTLVPGRRKGCSPKMPHWGCLAKFLLDHPGTVLPRSIEEISHLTGCSHDAVKTYLWRRREAVRRKARAIDFTHGTFTFEERTYPWKAAKDIDVYVDPYSFRVHVSGVIPAIGRPFAIIYLI